MSAALRAALACAVAGLAAVVTTAPAHADDVYFQAQTAATSVHFTLTQVPSNSIITASLVDDATAFAAGTFDSSGASAAQAASVYPGTLVVGGPALFCTEVFSCPAQPPSYPLLADASYPRSPHAHAEANQQPLGADPFVVTPADATATAVATGNTGRTAAGSVRMLAGTPVAVTVGASTSLSRVTTTATRLVVHVESTLSGITLGSLVRIRAVSVVDDITVTQGRRPTDHPHVTVAGVTVAGQPASIDERGIHVAGQDGPSLQQRVRQQGIAIRTVGIDRSETATGARSAATALSVDLSVPVSGVPYVPNPVPPLPPPFDGVPRPGVNANGTYVAHLTLGAVGAVGGIETVPSVTFTVGSFPPPPSSPSVPVSPGSPPVTAGAPAPGSPPQQPAGTVPPAQTPRVAAAPTSALRGFFDDLARGQLAALYAVLALGSAALFVGWRGTVLLRQGLAGSGRRR